MKARLLWTLLSVLLIGVLMGCSSGTQNMPSELPDETGVVQEIREPGGIGQQDGSIKKVGLLRILVHGERKLPNGEPSLVLATIGEDTQLLHMKSGTIRALKHSDLREGHKVKVWMKGEVLESYPAQAYARVVVVMD